MGNDIKQRDVMVVRLPICEKVKKGYCDMRPFVSSSAGDRWQSVRVNRSSGPWITSIVNPQSIRCDNPSLSEVSRYSVPVRGLPLLRCSSFVLRLFLLSSLLLRSPWVFPSRDSNDPVIAAPKGLKSPLKRGDLLNGWHLRLGDLRYAEC